MLLWTFARVSCRGSPCKATRRLGEILAHSHDGDAPQWAQDGRCHKPLVAALALTEQPAVAPVAQYHRESFLWRGIP